MTELHLLLMAIVAALGGYLLGRLAEQNRWRRNADVIQRIESGGRLYKVIHDKEYQP